MTYLDELLTTEEQDVKREVEYIPLAADDDTKEPVVRWRGHANLLFSNWLNYFVYQTTPYDIMSIGQEEEE